MRLKACLSDSASCWSVVPRAAGSARTWRTACMTDALARSRGTAGGLSGPRVGGWEAGRLPPPPPPALPRAAAGPALPAGGWDAPADTTRNVSSGLPPALARSWCDEGATTSPMVRCRESTLPASRSSTFRGEMRRGRARGQSERGAPSGPEAGAVASLASVRLRRSP